MAIRRISRKKYIDLEPRLSRPSDEVQQESIVPQSKADYYIRLGGGDPDQIYYYRQCVMEPERAVQNPQLRHFVADTLERALKLIFDDPQMWNRAQQLLRRKYPNQVASGLSEAAHATLAYRAARRGIALDAALEVFNRGLAEGGPNEGFARATSFIDGGRQDEDLRGVEVLRKIRRALRQDSN